MKTVFQTIALTLLALLLMFADNLFAQNGGNADQNTRLQCKAITADSLQAKNITTCKITFVTNDNRSYTLNAGDSVRFQANTATKIKTTNVVGECSGDNGWVEAGKLLAILPVTFGTIEAQFYNQGLTITWQTLNETNCSHFIPMISRDGNTWIELNKVSSKALNGNSNVPLIYRVIHDKMAAKMLIASTLLLCGLFRRKKKLLLLVAPYLLCGSMFIACTKKDVIELATDGKVYVKIMQVDIDGQKDSSKIIIANSNN